MIPDKDELISLYRKRAKNYDLAAGLFSLIGFRESTYRKKSVNALSLKPGDTVIDICCGTGRNFKFLQNKIGPSGKIIGIDITDHMLEQARKRTERHGWSNVELIQMDAAEYQFPEKINGIIATLALEFIPEYDSIIKHGARALSSTKGRFVIMSLKKPENRPLWLFKTGILLNKPFGASLEVMERRPWKSIEKYFARSSLIDLYWGFAYISIGELK